MPIMSILSEVISLQLFIPFPCESTGEDAHCYTANEMRSSILLSDYIKYVLILNLNT